MIRNLLLGFCFVGGTWFIASLRTAGFGYEEDPLWVGPVIWLTFLGIPVALLLIGLPRRMAVFRFFGLWITSVAISEGFALAQEIEIISRYGLKPAGEVTERRWWPFEHHDIHYTAVSGWTGTD